MNIKYYPCSILMHDDNDIPETFILTLKHFCSLQNGHQFLLALSTIHCPVPAKTKYIKSNIFNLSFLKYLFDF